MTQDPKDRRRHFRVQDRCLIDYQSVTDAELRGAMKNLALIDPSELSVTTTLRRLEIELQVALDKLAPKYSELAQCLDLLNSKLSTLAAAMPAASKQDQALMVRDVCECSLSASGIAFACREPLALGSKLRVRIVLLPDYFHITAFGEVVRVTPIENRQDDFTHEVGVDFLHILDRYRDALVRRCLQREIEDRRDARERRDAPPQPADSPQLENG